MKWITSYEGVSVNNNILETFYKLFRSRNFMWLSLMLWKCCPSVMFQFNSIKQIMFWVRCLFYLSYKCHTNSSLAVKNSASFVAGLLQLNLYLHSLPYMERLPKNSILIEYGIIENNMTMSRKTIWAYLRLYLENQWKEYIGRWRVKIYSSPDLSVHPAHLCFC